MAHEGIVVVQCQGQWLVLAGGEVLAVGGEYDEVWSLAAAAGFFFVYRC